MCQSIRRVCVKKVVNETAAFRQGRNMVFGDADGTRDTARQRETDTTITTLSEWSER